MSIPKFMETPEFDSLQEINNILANNNKNKFKLRFIIIFTLLSFAVSVIIIYLIYQASSKSRLAELKTQLTRLTEAVSINFNGDTHQKLVSEFAELKTLIGSNADEILIKGKSSKVELYHEIVYSKLTRFKKAFNLSRNQQVLNIYTMFKKRGNTDIFMGAHTEHPEILAVSDFDTVFTSNKHNQSEIIALKQAFIGKPGTDAAITTNETGTKLSGFSPMYDAHDNIVGIIGIDIDASDIRVFKWNFVYFSVIAFAVSFFLSLILATYLSGRIYKPMKILIESAREIGKGSFSYQASSPNHGLMNDFAQARDLVHKSLLERNWRNRILKPYVSEEVEEKIVRNIDLFKTQPTQSMGTVLNCTVQEFTSLIEDRTPEEVIKFLNEYFSKVKEIIFKYSGTFVRIDSSSISAVFGTPFKTEHPAENAVKCALEIHWKVNETIRKNIKNIWSESSINIGIDYSVIQAGYVGDERASQFTVAGNAVDFASHLASKNEEFETNILISESTFNQLQLELQTQKSGDVEDIEQTEISAEELCNFEIVGEFYISIKDGDEQTKVFAIEGTDEI